MRNARGSGKLMLYNIPFHFSTPSIHIHIRMQFYLYIFVFIILLLFSSQCLMSTSWLRSTRWFWWCVAMIWSLDTLSGWIMTCRQKKILLNYIQIDKRRNAKKVMIVYTEYAMSKFYDPGKGSLPFLDRKTEREREGEKCLFFLSKHQFNFVKEFRMAFRLPTNYILPLCECLNSVTAFRAYVRPISDLVNGKRFFSHSQ